MENINNYIDDQQKRGYYSFTLDEAVLALAKPRTAVRQSISRIKKKHKIAEPRRGFFVIIPPQYQRIECLPPDQFIHQLMAYLQQPYYVGLLSSAQLLGAAHQQPQIFQVMTNKSIRAIHCGKVRIQFIKKKNLAKLPSSRYKTPRAMIKVATAATTALDLVVYHNQAGGMGSVVNILAELCENIDTQQLVAVIKTSRNKSNLQRLGFLFDFLNEERFASIIEEHLKSFRLRPCLLSEKEDIQNSLFNDKWKIYVNTKLELEL